MDKKKINLIDIKKFLKGRKWEELNEKERLDISQKIVNLISQTTKKDKLQKAKKMPLSERKELLQAMVDNLNRNALNS